MLSTHYLGSSGGIIFALYIAGYVMLHLQLFRQETRTLVLGSVI